MKIKISMLLALCLGGIAFGAGTLTPQGAPAPTMKTLDEIDQSITQISNCVNQVKGWVDVSSLPGKMDLGKTIDYYIDKPGRYFLSKNLVATNDYCIYIDSSGVVLNLNGFVLDGQGSKTVGVFIRKSGCIVKNGTIVRCNKGVYSIVQVEASILERLIINDSKMFGIEIGNYSHVRNCQLFNNGTASSGIRGGISVGKDSVISGCIVRGTQGTHSILLKEGGQVMDSISIGNTGYGITLQKGCVAKRCIAQNNGSSGFYGALVGSLFEECIAQSNGVSGIVVSEGSMICDCISAQNQQRGIFATQRGVKVKHSIVRENVLSGIFLQGYADISGSISMYNKGLYGIFATQDSSVVGSISSHNISSAVVSYGVYLSKNSKVLESIVRLNQNTASGSSQYHGMGIFVIRNSTVKNCLVVQNTGTGIYADRNSLILENNASGNGLYTGTGAGIYLFGQLNRIEDNLVVGNDTGIMVQGTNNLVLRNTATGNSSAQFDIIAGQSVSGVHTNTGTIATSDSFKNFEF